jgi:hypothetical protein
MHYPWHDFLHHLAPPAVSRDNLWVKTPMGIYRTIGIYCPIPRPLLERSGSASPQAHSAHSSPHPRTGFGNFADTKKYFYAMQSLSRVIIALQATSDRSVTRMPRYDAKNPLVHGLGGRSRKLLTYKLHSKLKDDFGVEDNT